MINEITPIILAGGVGTRLWPLSRKSYPKQFLNLFSDNSLFQQAVIRSTTKNDIKFKPHITLTNSDYRFIVCNQFLEIGIDPGPIIIEPEAKNTAPAILSATLLAFTKNKDSVCLVSPSDHIIPDTTKFHEAISIGIREVQKGKIVTFGIKPLNAETGYGYLELEKNSTKEVADLVRFVEKPNQITAEKFVASDNFLWNSGIFLFRAKALISAFEKHAPNILFNIEEALKKSNIDLGFIRLNPESWSKCENISIDYAIMEKSDNLSVVNYYGQWSDLGDWEKVWQEMKPDLNGVSLSSNAHALDCTNTLLRSETNHQEIVGVGLNNIIAIAMQDAVLIAQKKNAQDVKNIIQYLNSKNIPQAEISTKDHRPWGWFEVLNFENNFKVKKLLIKPKESISLQSHKYRYLPQALNIL